MPNKLKKNIGAILMILIGGFYLINLFFGLDLIPDNIALIGNIDDGLAGALVYEGIRRITKRK